MVAVTLKTVAEQAGVSRSAVSRTYTDGASVSDKTRKKVEKAAKELGYVPSLFAGSLTTKRTKLIGLVTNNFENPLYLEIFDLFTKTLQKRGFRSLIVNLTGETDPEITLEMLHQYNVDGVIVAGSTLPDPISKSLANASIPIVYSFSHLTEEIHAVGTDDEACGALAAQALSEYGNTNIAIIGGPKTSSSTQVRISSFKKQAKKLELNIVQTVYAEEYSYDAGLDAWSELTNVDNIHSVFAADDIIAIGAMDAVRRSGIKVPDQVGFLGVNDFAMAKWQSYRLTTIKQPIKEITSSSVELVIALIDEPTRSKEMRRFPLKVVHRNTLKDRT